MNSPILKLNWKDWVNGLVMAVGGAILGVLEAAFSTGSFDVFTYDWTSIGKLALSAAVIYILKKVLTAENGKVLGKIG